MALTATATKRVCDDLKTMLRIEACESFSASVNRPNLLYEVAMLAHIKAHSLAYDTSLLESIAGRHLHYLSCLHLWLLDGLFSQLNSVPIYRLVTAQSLKRYEPELVLESCHSSTNLCAWSKHGFEALYHGVP